MSGQLLIHISEWTVLLMGCAGLAVILGATLYDFIAIGRRHRLDVQFQAVRQSRLPHVTILVYAREHSADMNVCLESIGRNQYQKYDIVVVENATVSSTRQAVQRYRQTCPNSALYFFRKRKATDRLTALRQGYKKSQRGDIVLVLDAGSMMGPDTLREGAIRFVADPRLQAVRLQTHLQKILRIDLVLQPFMEQSYQLYRKCVSLVRRPRVTAGTSGVFYGQAAFLCSDPHAALPCRYETSMYIASPQTDTIRLQSFFFGVSGMRRSGVGTRLGRLAMYASSVYAAWLISYFLYTAATLQSSSLLMLSWAGVSVWGLVGVWSDEAASWSEKLSDSVCVPVLYFILYVSLLVGIVKTPLVLGLRVLRGQYRGAFLTQRAVRSSY